MTFFVKKISDMKLRQIWQNLKDDPKDLWYYVQGNVRLAVYNSIFNFLIRRHIVEQFEYRKKQAKPCLDNGSCLCCGCDTPAVFFSDKGCKVERSKSCKILANRTTACYAPILKKSDWDKFKNQLLSYATVRPITVTSSVEVVCNQQPPSQDVVSPLERAEVMLSEIAIFRSKKPTNNKRKKPK